MEIINGEQGYCKKQKFGVDVNLLLPLLLSLPVEKRHRVRSFFDFSIDYDANYTLTYGIHKAYRLDDNLKYEYRTTPASSNSFPPFIRICKSLILNYITFSFQHSKPYELTLCQKDRNNNFSIIGK